MNIALTGGGTAGHIIPNIALIPDLTKYFNNIFYFGNKKGMEKKLLLPYKDIKFKHVDSIKFSRTNMSQNIWIPFKLPKYILSARKELKKDNINIVFSKGGYVALPVVIAAHSLRIPIVCHESDQSLGITNKITSYFSKAVITSFPSTKLKSKKYINLGMPLRNELFSADSQLVRQRHQISKSKPILLVMGGSLGSEKINSALYGVLEKLCLTFFVIHITGKNNNVILNNYISMKFITDIEHYIKAASVIVSRAGATACFEIAALNKNVLFIPLSKEASRGDQIDNAKYFKNNNYANVLYEENLNTSSLYSAIMKTFTMQKPYYNYDKTTNKKITLLIKKIAQANNRNLLFE